MSKEKDVTLKDTNIICLFCGKTMKQKWDEYNDYYECDCDDAKYDREIDREIEELKNMRPKHKYKIINKRILVKN